jgi:hypothetical protein
VDIFSWILLHPHTRFNTMIRRDFAKGTDSPGKAGGLWW